MNILFISTSKIQHDTYEFIKRELPDAYSIYEIFIKLDGSVNNYSEKNIYNILLDLKPNLIVIGNDSIVPILPFMFLAKEMGIPTLLVQDGIIGAISASGKNILRQFNQIKYAKSYILAYLNFAKTVTFFTKNPFHCIPLITKDIFMKSIYGNTYGMNGSTKNALFGNSTREHFIKRGVSTYEIVITGCPRFDYIVNQDRIFNMADIQSIKNKKILVVTQPFLEDGIWSENFSNNFMEKLVGQLTIINDAEIVIKCHPRENIKKYDKYIDRWPNIKFCQNEVLLQQLINEAGVIVGINSTVLLEALANNKKVVLLNYLGFDDIYGFLRSSCVYLSNSYAELNDVIARAFNEQVGCTIENNRKKYVYEQLYAIDGRASTRIVSLMEKLIYSGGITNNQHLHDEIY